VRTRVTGDIPSAWQACQSGSTGAFGRTSWRAESGRSDEGTLHLTGIARYEVRSAAEHGLERIGLVGGDDGTDLASEVDDKASRLVRSLPVEVGPVPRVARSPEAPLAGPKALDLDGLKALDLRVRDALGTEREVVGVDLQPVDAAHDRAVVVGLGHTRILSPAPQHEHA